MASGKRSIIMARTLKEELTEMGFGDRLEEFSRFIRSCGNETSKSFWGCGNGSMHILQVREIHKRFVILTENHEWDSGTGIGMATQLFVVDGEKLHVGKEIYFRDKYKSANDCWERYFRKISRMRKEKNAFVVTLNNPQKHRMEEIKISF
jgi:hypothetical protein